MMLNNATRRFRVDGIANVRGALKLRQHAGVTFRSSTILHGWNFLTPVQLKQLSGVGGGILLFSAGASSWSGPSLLNISRCEEAASSCPEVEASITALQYGLRADGSHGPLTRAEAAEQAEKAEKLTQEAHAGKLPVISLEEFQTHTSEKSLWVAYGGVVYDVTKFVAEHPGGVDALCGAGGQDLEVMWNLYPIHFTPKVTSALTPYAIGTLSDESMDVLRDPLNKDSAAATRSLHQQSGGSCSALRSSRRVQWRLGALWALTFSSSVWWTLRSLLRLLGGVVPVLGSPLAEALSTLLPCAVPGYGGAAPMPGINPTTGKRTRVAVIGGGISGCSCAFSLAESGYDVTVYESRKQLGGNAQCATFPVGKLGKQKMVTQDLSVLFWAPEYYRNYTALLNHLGLKPAKVELPYVIHTNVNGVSEFYVAPGWSTGIDKSLQPSLEDRFAKDLKKYDRMIDVVRKVNSIFSWGSKRPSFYSTNSVSLLPFCNPLNYVSMKTTARLFGCSEEFWESLAKPFHGLSMTTLHVDSIPGTALDILDSIAPLHGTRWAYTWSCNSQEVFKRTTAKCSVKLDTRVRQVQPRRQDGWQQVVIDDHGGVNTFDRVVLACPASAAANIIRPANWMERTLLRGVEYHDEFHNTDWKDWLDSPVHQDPSCLPERHRSLIMKQAAFLIDIDAQGRKGGGVNVEYTHNLGAFSPSARAQGVAAEDAPMFMTQCLHCDREIDSAKMVSSFSAPRGHPNLSTSNMVATQMLHLVQGRRGVYYCSNWTSPGNGHDLACTSGLAAASAIGAAYPFKCDDARRDHKDCRRFMWI